MKFVMYWKDGKRQEIEGSTISKAVAKAGYGTGALQALDFYAGCPLGSAYDLSWEYVNKTWRKKAGS